MGKLAESKDRGTFSASVALSLLRLLSTGCLVLYVRGQLFRITLFLISWSAFCHGKGLAITVLLLKDISQFVFIGQKHFFG